MTYRQETLNRMKGKIMKYSILSIMVMLAATAQAGVITLDGHHLTQEQAWSIAEGKDTVEISPEAYERLERSHQLVELAAKGGTPVYGLTVGVGLNKDKPLFSANGELSQEVREASKAFNRNALRSHSAGIGPMAEDVIARLQLVIRLNTLLAGQTGAQPKVAELYRDFLNKGITPQIPARGSVGEADITLSSHVGAVMMGEWKAKVDGKVVSGAEALKLKGVSPLDPQGKDALAILSTNAMAVAQVMKARKDAKTLADFSPALFALSLEGLNGNTAPVLPQAVSVHPFTGLEKEASRIRDALDGSYLWKKNEERALQDPLSFRTSVYVLREVNQALNHLDEELQVQLNSSDDNPGTILNADKKYSEHEQVAMYFVEGKDVKGAIVPTANFEPLPVAIAAQRLGIALTHLSHNSVQRTIHLSDEHFTGLIRFLSDPKNKGHAFGAIQKPFVALHSENQTLANPVSFLGTPVAGDIEDTFTNLPLVAERLAKIADNTAYIYSLELLHAAQAVDLRTKLKGQFAMGKDSQELYKRYRQAVKYVGEDRIFTDDIENGKNLIMNNLR